MGKSQTVVLPRILSTGDYMKWNPTLTANYTAVITSAGTTIAQTLRDEHGSLISTKPRYLLVKNGNGQWERRLYERMAQNAL